MNERANRQREELTGYRQIIELDQAVMAAILEKAGAVTVGREDIARHLQEKTKVRADWEPAADSYRLWTEERT